MKKHKLNPIREYIDEIKKYTQEQKINPHLLGKDVYPEDADITLYYNTLASFLTDYFYYDSDSFEQTIEKLLWLLEVNTGIKKYDFQHYIEAYYNGYEKCEEFGIVFDDINNTRIIFSIATDCEQTLLIDYFTDNKHIFRYTINEKDFLERNKNPSDGLNDLLIIKDYLIEAKNEHIIHKDIIERKINDFSFYETDISFVREEKIDYLLGLAG